MLVAAAEAYPDGDGHGIETEDDDREGEHGAIGGGKGAKGGHGEPFESKFLAEGSNRLTCLICPEGISEGLAVRLPSAGSLNYRRNCIIRD